MAEYLPRFFLLLHHLLLLKAKLVFGSAEDGIYTAYAKGEGCLSTPVCHSTACKITLNGVEQVIANNQPGFYFVTFSFPNFAKLETKEFATYFAENAGPMTDWINGLDESTVILGCSRDDASTGMNPEAWNALASIGMNVDNQGYRSGHALIGYKGGWPKDMRKSASASSGEVDVTYTYVLPPSELFPTLLGNYIELKWKRRGLHFENYLITANNSLMNDGEDMRWTVPAMNESSTIGPFRGDRWYTISMQVPFNSNNTHAIVPTTPFFIFFNETSNCSTGIYQFAMKIDGNKQTFKHSSSFWDDSSKLFQEMNSLNGFDRTESKPKAFNEFNVKRICAVMQDLASSQFSFIQIGTTIMQPLKDFVANRNGFPVLPPDTWNILSPNGIPYADQTCRQGFGVNDQGRKAELGFLGSSKGDCSSASNKNILIGYGLDFQTTENAAGSIYLDDSGTKVVKPAFGYILIPYFVDSVWNEWSSWSTCNATCGNGFKFRTRNSTIALGEGMQLPETSTSFTICKDIDCPPPSPANISVETKAKNKLLIKWHAIPSDQMTNTLSYYELEQWKLDDPSGKTSVRIYLGEEKEMFSLDIYTIYCYQVYGVLVSGMSGNRSEIACGSTDESVPISPPGNITVFNTSSFCLNVTWQAIPIDEAQGIIIKYRIYYDTASTGNEQYNDTTSNASHTICALQPYTQYIIKMSGFTSKGEGIQSSYTQPVSTDEYIPNGAPTIIRQRNTSSTSIEIEWQPLQYNLWQGVPLGYTIYYVLHEIYVISGMTSHASFVNVSYPIASVELTQLEKYKNYDIWMAAFTVKGVGLQNSSVVQQMTDEDRPCKGPLTRAYNTSSFSINVEWDPLEEPYRLGILTKYTVFYMDLKAGINGSIDVDVNENRLHIADLLPFHNHSFEVAAWTSKGMGPRGLVVFTFTDEYIPEIGPLEFVGTNISSYDLRLNWSLIPFDAWRGIPLGYTILYRETNAVDRPWNVSTFYGMHTLSGIIGNLTAYTNHTLRIAGFTSKGNGNFSNDVIITTDEDAPYISPKNFSSSYVNATSAVFRWLKPEGDKVKGILRKYKVIYRSVYTPEDLVSGVLMKLRRRRRSVMTSVITKEIVRHQINITVPSDQTEVALTNLQGYTNYSVQVSAITLREGPFTEPVYVLTDESVPTMSPVNVTAQASTHTSLMVTWKHMPPAYVHGILKGYIVYYQYGNHSNADAFSDKQIPLKEYLELTHLEIFSWYTIQVAAYTSVGIGVRSRPIYVRTGEYYPSKAPQNVSAESFLMPHDVDVKWLALPTQYWHGIPLGYAVTLTAHSAGGVELKKNAVHSIVKKVAASRTSCKFDNLMSYYKYSVTVSAFTKVANGPQSDVKHVETCSIARSVLFSSWIDSSPLVKHNPLSNIPDGLVPKILSGAVRKCSGTCLGIGIMNNATIDYVIDGTGQPSRKTNLEELMNKMTAATEFVFPVMKPSFANDKFKFIELIKVDSVVVVEGQPLVNNVGNNISSSLSSLFTVLLCFIVFCFASGCVVWILETWKRTGQLKIPTFQGILEGFYWAWVTATTVGYGDITPISAIGKCFAMFWSIAGLILCGFLSGALSSALTASENPLAKASAPKSGVGMVLDTWEISVARRNGMKIDQDFTSYSELLDAVANGTVRYGILDSRVAKIWTPKLAKDKIDIKRELKLDGSLGVFAAGNARQLHECFQTYIKEEASSILNAMQMVLEDEAAKVARLLSMPNDVTMLVSPSKPEFFSWGSVLMQAYVKTGLIVLSLFLIFGVMFELYKHQKKKNANRKIAPKIPRVLRRFRPIPDKDSDFGSCDFKNSKNNEKIAKSPNLSSSRNVTQESSSTVCYSTEQSEPTIVEEIGKLSNEFGNESKMDRGYGVHLLKDFNKEKIGDMNSTYHTTSFIWQDSGDGKMNSKDENTPCRDCQSENLPNCTSDTDLAVSCYHSMSLPLVRKNSAHLLTPGSTSVPCVKQYIVTAPCEDQSPFDASFEEIIQSYYESEYYDNEALEEGTRQLLADFEERFERRITEITDKHEKDRASYLQQKYNSDKKLYGGVYKYFNPKNFPTAW